MIAILALGLGGLQTIKFFLTTFVHTMGPNWAQTFSHQS
jgi:hypothetical protein